ncbi:MAG TPA: OB-fold nucleic acid binding domain-containing protein, partial [Ignavibacteria bacterium]
TFRLEDFTGSGECVVFPRTYEENKEILHDDAIVSVIGKAEENGNSIKLLADEIKPLFRGSKRDQQVEKLTIKIDSNSFTPSRIYEIRELFKNNAGETTVYISLINGSKTAVMELENIKIHYDDYSERILAEIFGKENIILN